MRRFLRILRAAFAGVSLLCCVVAAGVWVRSYFVADNVDVERDVGGVPHGTWWRTVMTRRGVVLVRTVEGDIARQFGLWREGWRYERAAPRDAAIRPSNSPFEQWDVVLPGFAAGRMGRARDDPRWIIVHLAYPTALFAVAPLAWTAGFVRRRRRARRTRAGLCEHCGYDLRASPERCPECGAEAMSNV